MPCDNKESLWAILSAIAIYALIIVSCGLLGCLTHSEIGYGIFAGVGCGLVAFLYAALALVRKEWLYLIIAIEIGIVGGLCGGFMGFVTDNYCILSSDNLMIDANASAPFLYSDVDMFRFRDDVLLLTSLAESHEYTDDDGKVTSSLFAAPIATCVQDQGQFCPPLNGTRLKVYAFAVDFVSQTYSKSVPEWDPNTRQAARLKSLSPAHVASVVKAVAFAHSDRLDVVDGATDVILTWGRLDDMKNRWGGWIALVTVLSAVGPFVGIFFLGMAFWWLNH